MDQRALTQKWLRENVVSYDAAERVYADVDSALLKLPSLRPKSDVYTYDDGRTQLLLCVHGLLPISFRAQSYNIPVAIWIPRGYPRESPLPYVVPTADMLVKPGPHLDVSGRSSIDYVLNWSRKSEGCSLTGLIDAMQAEFSRLPPVYSKPKDVQSPRQQQQSPAQHPPQQQQQSPPPIPTRPGQPPNLPPKPQTPQTPQVQNQGQPHYNSHFHPSQIQSPSPPNVTIPLGARPPPPLPRVDNTLPQYGPSPPHYQPPPTVLAQSAWGPSPPPPSREPQWSPAPPQHPPQLPLHVPVPIQAQPTTFTSAQHLSPAPPPNLMDGDAPRTPEPSGPSPTQNAGPAPPRPPNPELLRLHAAVHSKLNSELASLNHALALDAERLRAHQADLLAGDPALRDEMARLEAVRDVCRTAAGRMRGAVEAAERNVAELKAKPEPEVDELVCSTTIVHNQLINLVAEDNTIDDTIFHLFKALNSGRIDLERFLRTTRLLAEEQFMKRALIEKISTGIPMGQLGY
ncbi:UEV-domain-containing protein [Favolaschia claudopus]|uniref:UEV-domain-containing protein n=1 Tax=Favolaschia claudopus TaxID=2862362 RepID=A0AAW0AQJ7_9AGAR